MTLHTYLTKRTASCYRELRASLEGLSEAEAHAGADPAWRRYRFGVGLDGSIAGIVRHVAAWKTVFAAGLETGDFPDSETVLPADLDWPGLLTALESGHARVTAALRALDDAGLDREVTLLGGQLAVRDLFTILLEHDQYHAGQVSLLRQQRGHDLS